LTFSYDAANNRTQVNACQSGVTISALTKVLGGRDEELRWAALDGLEKFGAWAKPAAPAVRKLAWESKVGDVMLAEILAQNEAEIGLHIPQSCTSS
jgi:hypothetical protein